MHKQSYISQNQSAKLGLLEHETNLDIRFAAPYMYMHALLRSYIPGTERSRECFACHFQSDQTGSILLCLVADTSFAMMTPLQLVHVRRVVLGDEEILARQ